MTATSSLEANIRGLRIIGNLPGSTMLKLSHDESDPFTVRARFPLGMEGHCYFLLSFEMLEEACFSYGTVLGEKRKVGGYVRISPKLQEDFDHGSDEGLLFEFRVPLYGEYQVWLPLNLVQGFVREVASKMKAPTDPTAALLSELGLDAELAALLNGPRVIEHAPICNGPLCTTPGHPRHETQLAAVQRCRQKQIDTRVSGCTCDK